MSNEIKLLIENWVNEAVEGTDIFLVDVVNQGKNGSISVFIDADEGVNIDKCSLVGRYINQKLEERDPEHSFSVEVSSPGVNRSLRLIRQYSQHQGRILEVKKKNGELFKGWLKEIKNNLVVLEDRKINPLSNKKVKPDTEIDFDDIAESYVIVSFH